MACSSSAARRVLTITLRSRSCLEAPPSRAWVPASRKRSSPTICVRSFSSTRASAVDGVENPTPSEPVGQMEYASADDDQADSDNSPQHTESSETRMSSLTSLGNFSQREYKAYRKESSSRHQGDILTLRHKYPPSYDQIQKRTALFAKELQSDSTGTSGIEVAQGVYVLSHRSNTIRSTASSGFPLQVEFHRENNGNSLTMDLMRNLTRTFRAIGTVEGVNCVVLKAAPLASGKQCFSAGADIFTMAKLQTAEEATSFIQSISSLCTAIRDLPVPVIAAIDGPCIGAGLEVAASCDLRVGTSTATFSMPEVILGIPSVVEARLLCDIVGWGRARHLMFTGCTWSAAEALQAGLITAQFDESKDMSDWIDSFIDTGNRGFQVYRAQKALIRKWEDSSIDEGIAAGIESFAKRFEGPAMRKNVTGLIRKRLPGVKLFPSTKRLDLEQGRTKTNENGPREGKSTSVDSQEEQPQ